MSETGVNYLYTGSLRWRLQGGTITPESFAIAGGRATFNGSDWAAHYYITDHLGSTRAVTDALGNVLATFDYTPYGELLASSDSTTAGHFNRKSKVAVVASRNGVKSPLNRNVNYKPDLKIVRFTKP